jgi:hypothetical protein
LRERRDEERSPGENGFEEHCIGKKEREAARSDGVFQKCDEGAFIVTLRLASSFERSMRHQVCCLQAAESLSSSLVRELSLKILSWRAELSALAWSLPHIFLREKASAIIDSVGKHCSDWLVDRGHTNNQIGMVMLMLMLMSQICQAHQPENSHQS